MNNNIHLEPLGGGRSIFVSDIHRFGTDAFLLADFTAPKRRERCADLGTGCGIIPTLWLGSGCCSSVLGIEISPEAVYLAEQTASHNSDTDKFTVQCMDMRGLGDKASVNNVPREQFDVVSCNPPYFVESSGYTAPDPQRAAARCERSCTIDDVCAAARYLLRYGGRLCMCHRPERLADVICSMRSADIEPKRLRMVHQRKSSPPWLMLIEGKRGGKSSLDILPPLYMLGEDGSSSDEIENMYGKYREGRRHCE